ncbi:MAG: hypothetical protein O3C34_13300 [Proteobacteria bacterium]|nr:hypothetical protein [Pseudomonadota bacterium]
MPALRDIQTQLDQTSGAIERFRSCLAEGSIIDLTGLDQKIEGMCNAIIELPEDQRATIKATLIGLIDELNGLVELLSLQQDKVSEELQGVASRHKAVSAYGKSTNTTKRDKTDPAK